MANPNIQFLSFPGCPHAPTLREALDRALDHCGLPPDFETLDASADDCPGDLKGRGSPTILLNGRDLVGGGPLEDTADTADAMNCRVYPNGLPDADAIARALRAART